MNLPGNFSREINKKASENIKKVELGQETDLINDYKLVQRDLNSDYKFAIVIMSTIEYICEKFSDFDGEVLRSRDINFILRNDEELNNLVNYLI